MTEGLGMTCLYKNGEAKNFPPSEVENAEKDGWKDSPQPVEQAAAKSEPAIVKDEKPSTMQTSEVKDLK